MGSSSTFLFVCGYRQSEFVSSFEIRCPTNFWTVQLTVQNNYTKGETFDFQSNCLNPHEIMKQEIQKARLPIIVFVCFCGLESTEAIMRAVLGFKKSCLKVSQAVPKPGFQKEIVDLEMDQYR